MNEGTGMRNGAHASEGAGMDAQGAAVIMGEAQERARRELTVDRPAIFASWALVYLIGYGAVWLSVRGQLTPGSLLRLPHDYRRALRVHARSLAGVRAVPHAGSLVHGRPPYFVVQS